MTKLHFQRFEFKYYLLKEKAAKLLPALISHMRPDPYMSLTGNDFYNVKSVYFDSPDLGCFWDKESGVGQRKKMRVRFYKEHLMKDDFVFLEIKRKSDVLVTKDRIELLARDCLNGSLDKKLLEMWRKNNENIYVNELLWFKKKNNLRPKLYISYKRKAYVGKTDPKLRVTFDYDIQSAIVTDIGVNPRRCRPVYQNGAVLEIKYNNILPQWLHQIIQKHQLERLAYSKYCNGFRAVKPQLDDNNYSVI